MGHEEKNDGVALGGFKVFFLAKKIFATMEVSLWLISSPVSRRDVRDVVHKEYLRR